MLRKEVNTDICRPMLTSFNEAAAPMLRKDPPLLKPHQSRHEKLQ